ncbi:MAG: DUF86 domain-containing protein [Acidobacteria bacterium]|nr:DUF86 domain-containing protein [Acidobacteriota bacterium]
MQRDDAALIDIVRFSRQVLVFLEDVALDGFLADKMLQAAVLYQMLIIGEASKRLSVAFRTSIRDVPWVKIGNLRKILTHDYDQVDLKRIWGIALAELPALIDRLSPLIPADGPHESK